MKRRYYIDEQPLGSTSRSSDDVELLDETEQEELIHNLEKQTSFHHRIYRVCLKVKLTKKKTGMFLCSWFIVGNIIFLFCNHW